MNPNQSREHGRSAFQSPISVECFQELVQNLMCVNIDAIVVQPGRNGLTLFPEPIRHLHDFIGFLYNSQASRNQNNVFPEVFELSRRWGIQITNGGENWAEWDVQQFLLEIKNVIFELQKRTNSLQYRQAIERSRRNGNNVYQRMMELFAEGFEQTTKLVICRCDLHYHRYGSAGYNYSLSQPVFGSQFVQDRDQFLRALPELFGDDFIGYAWKAEYGDRKGPHIHLTTLLDGNGVQNDIWASRMISNEWVRITSGDGYAINCNARFKLTYEYCALGTILYNDLNAWEGINRISSYFAKPDFNIGRFLPNGTRTFGRSESFIRVKQRPGPKRRDELPLDFIRSLRRVPFGDGN